MKHLFTTGDIARLCSVSQQTIIRCIDTGELKGFRIPGCLHRRVRREDLLPFLAKLCVSEEMLAQFERQPCRRGGVMTNLKEPCNAER